MSDFQAMYEQKCIEYDQLKEELNDYQETSRILEGEMEQQIKSLEEQRNRAHHQLEDMNKKLESSSQKIRQLERDLETQRQQREQFLEEIKQKNRKIIDFEIEVDELNKAKREKEQLVDELEQKVDKALEQLEIVQTELEQRRNESQEQIERLKQQLRENQDELFVTKQKTQIEIERLTKSVRGSPEGVQIDKQRNIKQISSFETYAQMTPPLAEPRGLHKMDIELAEDEGAIRLQKSCSPAQSNSKTKLDSHFSNCSQNIQQLKVNTVGFSKSLNLISALIKDLDDKMCKIRSQKVQ